MYKVDWTSRFKKDYKKIAKQGKAEIVDSVIEKLESGKILEAKYKDHALQGIYKGSRECHIEPDLLLIYKKHDDILVLTCLRVGSHSELF
ncbi:type II toxin-antitoxin system YafQ family toxin [Helicobacter sp. T3_23-1056]